MFSVPVSSRIRSSRTFFTFTRREGDARSAFISGSRSVPPASGREPGARSRMASSTLGGLLYSKALKDLFPADRQTAEAHTDRVVDGVRDGGGRRNDRRLADAFCADSVRFQV